ncbi:tyrosine-type recombinase/integrase [Lacticaseibacillus jixiensis]|uniref:tyrosine-type recombinase/integrase n=1 Tax=Lacticaseibacillus jixiensis TaxID=3231926 RepID=UPI0036F34659
MPKPKQYELKPKFNANGKQLKPEKRWMIKGYLGLDPKTGLDKYTTLRGYETAQEARDAFETAVYEFKHGMNQVSGKSVPTVQEAYDMWYPIHKVQVRAATRKSIDQQFRLHILPAFGKYLINQLTLLDIQPWLNDLTQQYRSASVILGRLKLLMEFAGTMGWITVNPTQMARVPHNLMPKTKHPENNLYTTEELKAFSAALDQEAANNGLLGIERRAFFRVLISTGVRRGEAEALTWDNIDFANKTISITKTAIPKLKGENEETNELTGAPKTKNGFRTLRVGDDVLSVLMQWRNAGYKAPTGNWVFTSTHAPHTRISYTVPEFWMGRICKDYKLRRITVHGLRHTKATLMAEDNINPADIAGTLGHANAKFTMEHYVHNTQAGINNASDKYDELLEKTIWSQSGHKHETA